MSALNIISKQGKVSILTDTAAYGADGIVTSFGQKCFAIAHLKMAIASRGSMLLTGTLAMWIGSNFTSFDEAVEHFPARIRAEYPNFLNYLMMSRETELNICIAGWSSKLNAAKAYVILSDGNAGLNSVTPWKAHEFDPFTVMPMPSAVNIVASGYDLNLGLGDIDPVRHGLQMMEAQRATKLETLAGWHERHHIVGGHAVLTEVTTSGVSQRVIRQWPDRIGEPITPAPLSWQIHEHEPMSRQQRRAAERAARKGRAA